MIKIIASDMDGTLLNDKMQVSDFNAHAIREAQAAGIEFVVATGRGLTEAKPLLQAQQLEPAFITLNGAQVYDEDDQLVVDIPLTIDSRDFVIKTLNERGIYFELVTNQGIYSDSKVKRIQNVADLLVNLNPDTTYKIAVALAAARLELMNINYVDNYAELLQTPGLEVLKIIAFSSDHAALVEPKTLFNQQANLIVTSSSANNIEVNHINAQKGQALEAFAQQRHVSMNEVMAIGDNLNDESMIRDAKYGVAMANAVPQIKALAWEETKTNIEDGVGLAIKRAIELNQAE
ncbi:Cof-type HAD-IIB family hydrolase [Lacticaseibacillus saniviri]|uniref:Hydrolase of the HAD superfamily protein n=1 Tax=Lacticaseibacillus saniviri JCM 17471 = DSM 24301 TaxID=1293598 RepID=A0A0R2MXP1_9LACO|nr:Cof-type HAD-IIB family hydrolase [Lacticaseibacillus saniviri]KRO16589.1 hydrolase of the HAD superfamily protein [Lacticaseibacillus saniviri JCM 17471 = DSM 24301]MCG4282305.1 Cof-type HAD-IIB family hydrolase [Lacticaseibacillus saniviri]